MLLFFLLPIPYRYFGRSNDEEFKGGVVGDGGFNISSCHGPSPRTDPTVGGGVEP